MFQPQRLKSFLVKQQKNNLADHRQFGKPRRFLWLTRRQGRGDRRRSKSRVPAFRALLRRVANVEDSLARRQRSSEVKSDRPAPCTKKAPTKGAFFVQKKTRQRPTFPQNHSCSIIGAVELNFRVRDGNGCGLYAMVTGKLSESINF